MNSQNDMRMKRSDYRRPVIEIADVELTTNVLSMSSIQQVSMPTGYPELEVGGETSTADSRSFDVWD